MKSLIRKREQGFTLIEIVIVIAIAAALILLVFLAVSGAQKTKRDQINKTNAGLLGSQLENFSSNNGGVTPASATSIDAGGGSYMGNIVDALGGVPKAELGTATNTATTDIIYSGHAKCTNPNASGPIKAGTATQYAVDYFVESGQTDICIDNQ